MAETKEERRLRIQKEVAEESAARREAYFKAQEESKAKATAKLAPLPQPDAYVYDYAWKQGAGTLSRRLTQLPTTLGKGCDGMGSGYFNSL